MGSSHLRFLFSIFPQTPRPLTTAYNRDSVFAAPNGLSLSSPTTLSLSVLAPSPVRTETQAVLEVDQENMMRIQGTYPHLIHGTKFHMHVLFMFTVVIPLLMMMHPLWHPQDGLLCIHLLEW